MTKMGFSHPNLITLLEMLLGEVIGVPYIARSCRREYIILDVLGAIIDFQMGQARWAARGPALKSTAVAQP